MITPGDDHPHPVPPQAFMTWKENWVFPAIDPVARTAALFHFSLRPAQGEGIFTAKFTVDGEQFRHVGRSPIPADVTRLRPVADEHVSLEVLRPFEAYRLRYAGEDLAADLTYTGRFAPFDFADGPKPPGESTLGPIGLSVFPFHHYEQALRVRGTIDVRGRTIAFDGYGNRDHSWGWRDDFGFRGHHWVCASFDDRFVQGSVMTETSYPHAKHGGFLSDAAGNVAVAQVDTGEAYWTAPGQPLGDLDRDVSYRVTGVDGRSVTVTAHLTAPYGRLFLNARSPDRSQVYLDVQVFCDYTLAETGQRGVGVLEVGKHLEGPGIADRSR